SSSSTIRAMTPCSVGSWLWPPNLRSWRRIGCASQTMTSSCNISGMRPVSLSWPISALQPWPGTRSLRCTCHPDHPVTTAVEYGNRHAFVATSWRHEPMTKSDGMADVSIDDLVANLGAIASTADIELINKYLKLGIGKTAKDSDA